MLGIKKNDFAPEFSPEFEDYEFSGVVFDVKNDFSFYLHWGNGDWGSTISLNFHNDKIVDMDYFSD